MPETLALYVFSYEFCEISKNTFFTEHVWTTASDCWTESVEIEISEHGNKLSTTKKGQFYFIIGCNKQ